MTLAEMLDAILQKLDNNNLYYPPEELVINAINPAQRLVSLHKRSLSKRATAQINAAGSFVDLRRSAPRCFRLSRVVLGDITGEDPTASSNEYRNLFPLNLNSLQWKRDWVSHRGGPTHYWLWGGHWLGIYKRPFADATITLIFKALPLPFTTDDIYSNPAKTSELPPVEHQLVVDVAFALAILKEGSGEVEKAEAILSQTFGQEATRGLRRLRYAAANTTA